MAHLSRTLRQEACFRSFQVCLLHCKASPSPLILDADTANEVDDLYAIVSALLEPRLNIVDITSAQYHASLQTPNDSVGESQRLNKEILELMNRKDIPIPLDSNSQGSVNTKRPLPSKAAEFIIEKAHSIPDGKKLI